MPGTSSPRQEKERFWRYHIDQQARRGGSVRAYCLAEELSHDSFFWWRRVIRKRDLARVSLKPGTEQRPPGVRSRSSPACDAGLIALDLVCDPASLPTTSQTLDIICPDGPVIRLREDASVATLERVIVACRQADRSSVVVEHREVRSC